MRYICFKICISGNRASGNRVIQGLGVDPICQSNINLSGIQNVLYDGKNLQCYSRNNFTPFMYLLLLGQAASFMHCCDTVLFQRFMHLKACNGYGLNATLIVYTSWLPTRSCGRHCPDHTFHTMHTLNS